MAAIPPRGGRPTGKGSPGAAKISLREPYGRFSRRDPASPWGGPKRALKRPETRKANDATDLRHFSAIEMVAAAKTLASPAADAT
jgi:hypothetical protein